MDRSVAGLLLHGQCNMGGGREGGAALSLGDRPQRSSRWPRMAPGAPLGLEAGRWRHCWRTWLLLAGTHVQSRVGEYVNCILLNTLLKLRQGQSPGTPLRSLVDRPRSPFHQTLGVKHPITNYSTLSNLVHLARSRPAVRPLPRERPYPDSTVHKRPGGIAASPWPSVLGVATNFGNSEGARGRSPPRFLQNP